MEMMGYPREKHVAGNNVIYNQIISNIILNGAIDTT
jgi:hypothetical protein